MERHSSDGDSTQAQTEQTLRNLMLAGLDGDAAAYRRFLQQLGTRLRSFYRRRLSGWPDDVEDLVQDTLLAIHNQRHTYQPGQPVTAWVHAIARYKTIDLLRARQAREALHDPLDDDANALFDTSDSDAAETRRDLDQLLATLPERQRVPIEQVKLEGRSVADVARETGMSESAVKIGIHRGLKALAARIAAMPKPRAKGSP
ncbi:sigma-70 family RNA polymerase sigma factor [Hydrogenophaga sp. BPS33]|uniref:sigma-70 family RNA polymerase sigma factor n=1 Tax=Hydrogenophaga sp. BPS33 TaxID=2651974 RepID=UPI0013203A02|nr:sigma-70 family RNA polymerase sigma factor [Hydrogenophaga sp. BPS33]QHE83731.1 sigma-70 family RNA polymerase sigma factor [Hydrogenophaga sp. BPS33]